jgi:hypothetical protein
MSIEKHHFARSLDCLLRVAWTRCVLLCTSRGRSTEASERMGFEPKRNEAPAEAAGSVAAKLIERTSHTRSGSAALPFAIWVAAADLPLPKPSSSDAGCHVPQEEGHPRAICRPAMSLLKEILKYKSWLRSRVHRKGSYPQHVTAPALPAPFKGIK